MSNRPTAGALRREIARSFGGSVSLSATSAQRADSLYEHFLLGLVLRAARLSGATIRWCNTDNRPTPVVKLRGGPGEIWTDGWSHAELLHDGRDVLEVHAGVMVTGGNVAHQADVLVLPSGRGRLCRARKQQPRAADVELVIEAKYYGRTEVDLLLARSVLGLHADLKWNPVMLVTSRIPQRSAIDLLEGWGAPVVGEVRPGSRGADQVVQSVRDLL